MLCGDRRYKFDLVGYVKSIFSCPCDGDTEEAGCVKYLVECCKQAYKLYTS
jgi:hypothetical protein